MRYRELCEGPEQAAAASVSDRMFYHITTDNRLKSIMATGLEPGRHRRWKNTFGATLGDRGFVYLISDFTEAVRFAARQDYYHRIEKKKMKTIILCLRNVPTDGLERDPHIEGQLAGHTWYKTPATIAPQDIVRVIPYTFELGKQAVNSGSAQMPPEELPSARTA